MKTIRTSKPLSPEEWINKLLENPGTLPDTLKLAGAVKELYEEVRRLKAELEAVRRQGKPSSCGLIEVLGLFSHRLTGWTSGSELYNHCRRIAGEEGIEFPYSSPRALGNKLHHDWQALVEELSCEKKKGRNNETLYYFPRS